MSGSNQLANCSTVSSRSSFSDYVQQINATTTGFNITLLNACQSNICNALWGDGNADISGIGMVIGYVFESVLGLLFALGLVLKAPISKTRFSRKYNTLLAKGCATFFDCAVFFTISIQISCVVVLVRRDFSISANGLGGLTTQITWAIALLCILPLIHPLVVLRHILKEKEGYRLFLFCGCWVLFFYTFISQMIGEFAPSQIGEGAGEDGTTIITTEEWNTLTALCFSGIRPMSSTEQKVFTGFGAAGSLVVSTYGLVRLVWFIVERQWPRTSNKLRAKVCSVLPDSKRPTYEASFWILLLTLLTIPQFWGVFRLRGIQKTLAKATSNAYADDQWTFGQVVAVTIFAPVFTEVGYFLVHERGSVAPESSPESLKTPP